MEPNDPPPRKAEQPEDVLRRLEERLGRASEAAERLMSEAALSAGSLHSKAKEPDASRSAGSPQWEGNDHPTSGAGPGERQNLKPPPAGWQAPEEHRRTPARESELIVQAFQSLRDLIPPELQQRLVEAVREVLLALRALIDWYIERLERRRAEPTEVEDIPIR